LSEKCEKTTVAGGYPYRLKIKAYVHHKRSVCSVLEVNEPLEKVYSTPKINMQTETHGPTYKVRYGKASVFCIEIKYIIFFQQFNYTSFLIVQYYTLSILHIRNVIYTKSEHFS
jgi:hypothetical protein